MLHERRAYDLLGRIVGSRNADRLASGYRNRLQPWLEFVAYMTSSEGRQSRRALIKLRDRYSGLRCYIIGNGPSLNRTPLERLGNEYTFALNRGYLLADRLGSPPTFLVAVNRYVTEQFGSELAAAPSMKFVGWRARHGMAGKGRSILVRRGRPGTFATDIAKHGAWEGATVTYVALQLAFHMGFHEVVLVGVDHSFATSGTANELVTSQGGDPNHFDPQYFGKGIRWQLPDLATSEAAYRLARHAYEASGRRVLDATVGGQLDVFPKVDLAALSGVPRESVGRSTDPA